MDNSPIIRFRLDREIAERAHRMAAERGLELPDIMRMMLTKAVRIGDFSIDQEQPARAQTPRKSIGAGLRTALLGRCFSRP